MWGAQLRKKWNFLKKFQILHFLKNLEFSRETLRTLNFFRRNIKKWTLKEWFLAFMDFASDLRKKYKNMSPEFSGKTGNIPIKY